MIFKVSIMVAALSLNYPSVLFTRVPISWHLSESTHTRILSWNVWRKKENLSRGKEADKNSFENAISIHGRELQRMKFRVHSMF